MFPTILAGWSLRQDQSIVSEESIEAFVENSYNGSRFYFSTIFSYAIGCLACEILQTGRGQPALVFIVPSMLIGLLLEFLACKIRREYK